jgi:hypothetical protein
MNLVAKAAAELVEHGETPEIAFQRLQDLQTLFQELL